MAARIEIRTNLGVLDLIQGAETEFYVTRQVFDLNDFETRNADFTKSLRIPTTPNNVKLLGAIADSSGTTGEETRKIRCTILMDGITIAPLAWLLLFKTTFDGIDQFFESTIFYGNFNMFDQLSGDTIDKINWADLAVEWEPANLLPLSENTYLDNNLVYPVCDWLTRESIPMTRGAGATANEPIDINPSGFFIYARTVMERMLLEAGYTLVVGTVPTDFNLIALACPVTTFFPLTDTDQVSFSTSVRNINNQIVVGITERVVMQTVDSGTNWDIGTNQFSFNTATTGITVKLFGTYDYNRGHPNNPASRIVIFQNGLEIDSLNILNTQVNIPFFMSVVTNVVPGDLIYAEIQADNTNAPATLTMELASKFQVFSPGADSSRLVQPSDHIPQMVQSTFFANILKLFNLIMVTDDVAKTVTLNSFDTLFTNAELDLSKNIAGGREPIEIDHYLGSLGQNSILQWQDDNLLRRDYFHNEKFNNEILNKEVTVISMDFSACDSSILWFDPNTDLLPKSKIPFALMAVTEIYEGETVTVSALDNNFTFSSDAVGFNVGDYIYLSQGNELQWFRIVTKLSDTTGVMGGNPTFSGTEPAIIDRVSAEDVEPRLAIIYRDGGEENYRMWQGDSSVTTNFTINSLTSVWADSLLMSSIADTYYAKTFASLQSPQVIRAMFNLSVLQVANFDFLRPIYLSSYNAFYYANKIEQFKVDSLTRMELVRITEGIPKADPITPPPGTQFKANIVRPSPTPAIILINNLDVNGGSTVEPVGFALFIVGDTLNMRAGIKDVSADWSMQLKNVGDEVIIFSFALTDNVQSTQSVIISDLPLWDGGDVQYQVLGIQP